jgi:lipoyl(octanoyl) transferase
MKHLDVIDLGSMPYMEAWDLQKVVQKRLIDRKRAPAGSASDGEINDVLLYVEHPHVYTLGKSGNAAHLLAGAVDLERIGATYVKNDRGGDITYHGPGQIVGYPILDLDRHFTDIHRYLRELEEVMIRVCADYGFRAGRVKGLTGVWVDDAKICAFGVKCSRWVTMHGFAFNVNTDLDYFGHIVPCGITDRSVTSLQKLAGQRIDPEEVRERITGHFASIFGVIPVLKKNLAEAGIDWQMIPAIPDAPDV